MLTIKMCSPEDARKQYYLFKCRENSNVNLRNLSQAHQVRETKLHDIRNMLIIEYYVFKRRGREQNDIMRRIG